MFGVYPPRPTPRLIPPGAPLPLIVPLDGGIPLVLTLCGVPPLDTPFVGGVVVDVVCETVAAVVDVIGADDVGVVEIESVCAGGCDCCDEDEL